ncbi:MAG: hypothetical protein M1356_04330 [Gammaproteobacteria bacterium]|nr:hypothetical protein [Gammaproteobacteria bacterium]
MPTGWKGTVTVTNGSPIIEVTGGADVGLIRDRSYIQVGTFRLVEVLRSYKDSQGNQFIELIENWEQGDESGRAAIAFPTGSLSVALERKIKELLAESENITDNVLGVFEQLLTSTEESITLTLESGDVVVMPYGYLKQQLQDDFSDFIQHNQQQIDEATGNVDRFNAQLEFDRQCTMIADFANNRYELYDGVSAGNKERTVFSDFITFTRASDKTGFDAIGVLRTAGNDTPVMPWQDGEPQGVSIHGQRTNNILNSNNLTMSPWQDAADQSPDASIFTESNPIFGAVTVLDATAINDNARCERRQDRSLAQGAVHTLSARVIKGTGGFARLSVFESGLISSSFTINVDTGAIINTTGASDIISNSVVDGGEFWTLVLTFTVPSGSVVIRTVLNSSSPSGSPLVNGNGGLIKVADVQMEQGAFATPPIITSGTSLTRIADNCRIENVDQAPWFNQSEGTFVVEFDSGSFNLNTVIEVGLSSQPPLAG